MSENQRKREQRAQFRELIERGRDWVAANPDHCPECFCRPGEHDSEQGTDHEAYCPLRLL